MPWYVIVTKPSNEFIAQENLRNQNYSVFLPTCQVQKKRGLNLKLQVEPLFRSYLFIELDLIKSNWYPIKSTKGVKGFLTFGGSPVEVSEKIVKEIQDRTKIPQLIKELFEPGDKIKINHGPFKAFDGIFEKLTQNSSGEQRALLLVELLGRQQSLAFPLNQIESA